MKNKTEHFLNCHTEESVKIRFKKLSKQLHPDKNGGTNEAKEKFQDMISERDEVLTKIYQKDGKTDAQIQEKIKDLFSEGISMSGMESIGTAIAQKMARENPGKELSFADALKYTLEAFTGKKQIDTPKKKEDPKKLE